MEKVIQTPGNLPNIPVPQISTKKGSAFPILVAGVLVILAGTASGWAMASQGDNKSKFTPETKSIKSNGGTELGIADESTFKDTAEGTLVEGGIDGEGTYHLERPGGASQNVYLTSTVIDLGSFKDKKVQVWGQTLAGKKAGWLMDVGKLRIVE